MINKGEGDGQKLSTAASSAAAAPKIMHRNKILNKINGLQAHNIYCVRTAPSATLYFRLAYNSLSADGAESARFRWNLGFSAMVQPAPGSKLWTDAGLISKPTTVASDDWAGAFGQLEPEVWTIFQALIATSPPLKPSDLPLIHAYARATLLEQKASRALLADVAGAPSSAVVVYEQAVQALAALSRSLGLSPAAREQRRAPGRPPKPKPVVAPGEQTS
jgi:hypothetical protein